MFFVITILLTFNTGEQFTREYKLKSFNDTWSCHQYIADNKVKLLTPHLETFKDQMTGFEFYCESRYGEEV
jgi:hypothetical protein|tara:strand:+ start:21 stop:233 length:213 start_codon:yes stop_codon:yes gene_type:complete